MSLAEVNHVQVAMPWQQVQWEGLLARLQEGRMPHALMLRGEEGTGKNQFALALELGTCLEDISGTIHVHPTLGEATMEAALAGLGKAIHA